MKNGGARATWHRYAALAATAILAFPLSAYGATSPTRALTLAPHVTELMFAAGAGQYIAGTIIRSDYPAAARQIPRIGDGMNVDVEKALSLQPDVVIGWQSSGAVQTLGPVFERLHVPVLYSRPESLNDIPSEIIRYGKLFGTEARANAAAQTLQRRIAVLEERYAQRRPVTVFIEIGTSPLYTIGGEPLLRDALRICGGVNIFATSPIAAPQVSMESVLVKNPNVVLTPAKDTARLEEARGRWAGLNLPAALNGQVYGLDPDELFRPGPRLVDATEVLCRHLDKAR